jgi:putative hemolysin
VLTEISVVVLLTLLNGVLAMSELAVVSSRPVRLRILADQGNSGAAVAIRLADDPGRFLSTVQIGITLVGVLSGAFSGATLGARLAGWLQAEGLSKGMADGLGVGSVVVAITYLSLIVGELVPKQIALRAPEAIACKVAPAMAILSKVALPLVWLLDASGMTVLALLGQKGEADEKDDRRGNQNRARRGPYRRGHRGKRVRNDLRGHAPRGPDRSGADDTPARRRGY